MREALFFDLLKPNELSAVAESDSSDDAEGEFEFTLSDTEQDDDDTGATDTTSKKGKARAYAIRLPAKDESEEGGSSSTNRSLKKDRSCSAKVKRRTDHGRRPRDDIAQEAEGEGRYGLRDDGDDERAIGDDQGAKSQALYPLILDRKQCNNNTPRPFDRSPLWYNGE
jgi:hypothetical protein